MTRFPVTFITGQHYKVDKSYIWLGSVVTTLIAIFAVAISSIEGIVEIVLAIQRGFKGFPFMLVIGLSILAFVVIFGIIVLIYYLSYKNMSFVFDERELSFYSGIIVKKRVHLPYERVQSVNQHASLLQRIVGVCTVVVDSAGGSTNKGVRIPYVRLQIAERMRSELFVRKAAGAAGTPVEFIGESDAGLAQGVAVGSAPANVVDSALGEVAQWRGVYGGAAYAEEPVTFEYGLSNKQLALASFTHPGALAGGLSTAFGLFIVVLFMLLLDQTVAAVLTLIAIPLVVGAAVGIWIIASLGILFGYANFKVRRRGTRIEIERGLITRHLSGIDVTRIQSIDIKQSTVRNLMHYCEVSLGRIDVQSSDANNKNTESKGLVIHPFLQLSQLDGILSGLLPEYDARPRLADCKPLPRIALRRSILRRCLWFNWALWSGLVLIACLLIINWVVCSIGFGSLQEQVYFDSVIGAALVVFVVCIVVATVVAAIGSVMWARHSGYCFEGRFLLIHNGGIYTATSLLPRQKIQSGHTRTNPFQRRLDLKTLVATTAAGYRKTDVRLIDVPQTDAVAYLDWLS